MATIQLNITDNKGLTLNRAVLTPRETQVAQGVVEGKENSEIAQQLDCRTRTVKAHLTAIYKKTYLSSRYKLALQVITEHPESISVRNEKGEVLSYDALISRLSKQETKALECIIDGMDSKEIAHHMGIAPKTLKCHTTSIYKKLGLGQRKKIVGIMALLRDQRDKPNLHKKIVGIMALLRDQRKQSKLDAIPRKRRRSNTSPHKYELKIKFNLGADKKLQLKNVWLSSRESEILAKTIEGQSRAKIAEVFDLPPGMFSTQVSNICKKTGLKDIYQVSAQVVQEYHGSIHLSGMDGDDSSYDALISRLSDEQIEFLEYLMEGKSNKDVARDTGKALNAVEVIYHRIRKNLGLGNRIETLVAMNLRRHQRDQSHESVLEHS